MIRTAITAAHTPAAGRLLRLLLNHPDVEVTAMTTTSPVLAGHPVTSCHKGLDGDTDLRFSTSLPAYDRLDAIFVVDEIPAGLPDDLVAIALHEVDGWVYGLPELNRKPLVRGARHAFIPSAEATAVATPLLPLAANLMLKGPLKVTIEEGALDGELPQGTATEIGDALRALQSSFDGEIIIERRKGQWHRGTVVTTDIPCSVAVDEIDRLARDFFGDHNLTHIVSRRPMADDVATTAKCLVNYAASENGIRVSSAIDGLLKGQASQAVHVMNLLHGLQEKTGLYLPASE